MGHRDGDERVVKRPILRDGGLPMTRPIVYLDRSRIQSTDIAGLREAVANLTEFVREHEPQLLLYGFEIDETASTLCVFAIHPDSESLELHLGIGGPEFRKVGAFIDLQQIEVIGNPSADVLGQLRQKAAILGTDARVVVREPTFGFERLSAINR
jgi:hypothetical protein